MPVLSPENVPGAAVLTTPGGSSHLIPPEMARIAGRGSELKAIATRVKAIAEALVAAVDFTESAPLIKGASLTDCSDAAGVVESQLVALSAVHSAISDGLIAFKREITTVAIERDGIARSAAGTKP